MTAFFRFAIWLLALFGINAWAAASNDIQQVFNQDIQLKPQLDGTHFVRLSKSLKQKQAKDVAQVVDHIRYVGLSGESHQLLNAWQHDSGQKTSKIQPKVIPLNHQLSAKISADGFVLPKMEFAVGLVVLDWQETPSEFHHIITSTWLLNKQAGEQFADKRSQTLSIRPLINSRFLTVGNDLPIRLYYKMGGVSTHLYAKHHGTGEITVVESDEVGMAVVKLKHDGLMSLMVQMDEGDKKFTSFLNFEVTAGASK